VVGINTAIITTSGSSAGIGFAVPADQIQPKVQQMIRQDRQQMGMNKKSKGWLGVSILRQSLNKDAIASNGTPLAKLATWVTKVDRNSPASDAGIRSLFINDMGRVIYGDAIVAVGGNEVSTLEELQTQLEDRVVGEQVALTVEDGTGDRRVVYVTLSQRPNSDKKS
jgi:S1-C subfamily serine protease